MVGSGDSGQRRTRRKQASIVVWIRDADGQLVEQDRRPKGTCDFCAKLAYRVETVEGRKVLVCESHRARVLRTGTSRNAVRVVRKVDLEMGQRLLARNPKLSAPKLAAAINALRAEDGLPPISVSVIFRRFLQGQEFKQPE